MNKTYNTHKALNQSIECHNIGASFGTSVYLVYLNTPLYVFVSFHKPTLSKNSLVKADGGVLDSLKSDLIVKN